MIEDIILSPGKRYKISDFIKSNKYFILRVREVNIGNANVDDQMSFYADEDDLLKELRQELEQFKFLSVYDKMADFSCRGTRQEKCKTLEDEHHGDGDSFLDEDYFYKYCTATTDHVNDHYKSIEVSNLTPALLEKIRALITELYKQPGEQEPKEAEKEIDASERGVATIIATPFILSECRST